MFCKSPFTISFPQEPATITQNITVQDILEGRSVIRHGYKLLFKEGVNVSKKIVVIMSSVDHSGVIDLFLRALNYSQYPPEC